MAVNYRTLLVSRPSRMRDSFRALLLTIPGLGSVSQLDDAQSAVQAVVDATTPTLVILDADLPEDGAWIVLKNISTKQPLVKSIALIDNMHQKNTALLLGADKILLKGFSTMTLVTTVEQLQSVRAESELVVGNTSPV